MVDKIKELCKRNNTSIAEIERECGFGNGSIRKWDDTSPTVARVKAVADFLNVSVIEIIGNEKNLPKDGSGEITQQEFDFIRLFRLLPSDLQADVYDQVESALRRRGLLPE